MTVYVDIRNVSNTDLTSILECCKREHLHINKQSLSTAESRGVVWAMANVEEVALGDWGEVTLDINTLVTYGGRGKCERVEFYHETARKYREDVRRLAQRISWTVTTDKKEELIIEKKLLCPVCKRRVHYNPYNYSTSI